MADGNDPNQPVLGQPYKPDVDAIARDYEMYKASPLIHESFPPQGEEKRAHEGSQSQSPRKRLPEEDYMMRR